MKLEVRNGMLWFGRHASMLGGEVRAILSAIDAGHLDALRHFAAHGKLPLEPPVWPGLEVVARAPEPGWLIRSPQRGLVAVVYPSALEHPWGCEAGDDTGAGDTPQSAVDAARKALFERWGPLS